VLRRTSFTSVVTVAGTTIGSLTDAEGRYTIRNVPRGRLELSARTIGYRLVNQVVTVPSEGEVDADFALRVSALSLDEIVVTASGNEQAAREMPAPPSTLDFGKVPDLPITDMTDALNGRLPGVEVMPSSGTTGAGTRIRIRGSGSLSLSNDPVLYIDGVRVENGANSNSLGVGGQVPSRINDLDPEEIESIEVIKGPAAAALYGTDAANGIINVKTKRGHSGPATWRLYAEGGTVADHTNWPDNIFGFDTTKAAPSALRYGCTLQRVSQGLCAQTGGLLRLNPLKNNSPFRTGHHGQYGASVSGGGERVTYFLSTDITRETGVYLNNDEHRLNLRANVSAAISPILDVGVQTGFVESNLTLPDNDNDALGILGSGLLGSSDTTKQGWGFLLPSQTYAISSAQRVDRVTGGANADFRPLPWLSFHSTAGLDYTSRFDTRTIKPNQVPFNTSTLLGSRNANPITILDVNAKASGQARFRLAPTLTSQTTVGVDYFHSRAQSIFASGQKLAAGTSSLAGIGIPAVSEDLTESKTFGVYGEEVLGWRDRVFVTGSVRRDENSAFGKNFNAITYPKVGGSWVISDESFFPRNPALSTMRLRASYGVLGLAPGATDALQYFTPVAVTDAGGDQVAFTVGSLGNASLKPERVHETEVGFDAGLLRDKIDVVFSYYAKLSNDALVARTLAPSLGVSTTQFFNLGQVANKGYELSFTGRAFDVRGGFALDLGLSFWANANKLVDLGKDPLGNPIPPIVLLRSQQHRTGYPLGGYWVKPIVSYNDADNDGIITSKEVTLDTAFRYAGTPIPTHGWGFTPTLTLFKNFRITATFDHRGGNVLYNDTGDFRCRLNICPELNDPKTPLARQAQAVADVFLGQPSGYIEKADFTKLRELSITYSAPASWARMVGGSAVSFTLAGRNLHTWTKYSGSDPELNELGQNNFLTDDFLTQPPVRYWNFRVNYTF
jgi:TonB-linked SusC/RagA family outer membrane protein